MWLSHVLVVAPTPLACSLHSSKTSPYALLGLRQVVSMGHGCQMGLRLTSTQRRSLMARLACCMAPVHTFFRQQTVRSRRHTPSVRVLTTLVLAHSTLP